MNILQINNNGQENYSVRHVVKLVLLDQYKNIHYLGGGLIGGGLEDTEDFITAANREALEEVGYTIKIVRELGEVIAYRDILEKKYITKGFQAEIVSVGEKTTTQEDELDLKVLISPLSEASAYYESRIVDIESNKSELLAQSDMYQSKLFNAMTALAFLKKLG
jgi:8-oxo-dGTP pyrophosphatase MutT (NUDIX family)